MAFRERLTQTGMVKELFAMFVSHLENKGLIFNEGQIIDASFNEIPRQPNSCEDNKMIKDENGDDLWNDNLNKKRHKDIDARWIKKNGSNYYGYKNHIKVDAKSKIIQKYYATDASINDSKVLEVLFMELDQNQELYADSTYSGTPQEESVSEYDMINMVH